MGGWLVVVVVFGLVIHPPLTILLCPFWLGFVMFHHCFLLPCSSFWYFFFLFWLQYPFILIAAKTPDECTATSKIHKYRGYLPYLNIAMFTPTLCVYSSLHHPTSLSCTLHPTPHSHWHLFSPSPAYFPEKHKYFPILYNFYIKSKPQERAWHDAPSMVIKLGDERRRVKR